MKTARPLIAVALLGSASLFACASGGGGTGGGGSGGTGPSTSGPTTTSTVAGNTVASTGVTGTSGTGGACAPTCQVDNDCGHTCPAVPSGESNCCDTMTNMCYINNFSTCPPPNTTTSGGGGMSQY